LEKSKNERRFKMAHKLQEAFELNQKVVERLKTLNDPVLAPLARKRILDEVSGQFQKVNTLIHDFMLEDLDIVADDDDGGESDED
jgi:hypothetical protein